MAASPGPEDLRLVEAELDGKDVAIQFHVSRHGP
jgi:hypothetical protein